MTSMAASRGSAPTPEHVEVCGVRITAVGPQQAIDLMLDSAHGESRGVHLCNAYTLSLAMRS
ncbi:MAG: hypothetical protein QOF53_2999, partial [Nocardioidaceae bacterium]|nr:hypothetical protein [Nocardioidaceae bacterium]